MTDLCMTLPISISDPTSDTSIWCYRALHRFLECAYGLTSQNCGESGKSASEFLRTYTEKAVGSLITSTCRKFPTGNELTVPDSRVVEIDVGDGLREVGIQQDIVVTTMLFQTSTRPSRASRKGLKKNEGRRNKGTTPLWGGVTPSPSRSAITSDKSQKTSGQKAASINPTGGATSQIYDFPFLRELPILLAIVTCAKLWIWLEIGSMKLESGHSPGVNVNFFCIRNSNNIWMDEVGNSVLLRKTNVELLCCTVFPTCGCC